MKFDVHFLINIKPFGSTPTKNYHCIKYTAHYTVNDIKLLNYFELTTPIIDKEYQWWNESPEQQDEMIKIYLKTYENDINDFVRNYLFKKFPLIISLCINRHTNIFPDLQDIIFAYLKFNTYTLGSILDHCIGSGVNIFSSGAKEPIDRSLETLPKKIDKTLIYVLVVQECKKREKTKLHI